MTMLFAGGGGGGAKQASKTGSDKNASAKNLGSSPRSQPERSSESMRLKLRRLQRRIEENVRQKTSGRKSDTTQRTGRTSPLKK
ncbi:unnamed protein product [Gongylonema pulchrum]|uniref:Secreted protein n=1 Tax=Gongylonema pulchrum TaxID=637853 RepID=A0A183EQB4_9BILA|nr:unnamed protein product [Gongylonema pulchrum]